MKQKQETGKSKQTLRMGKSIFNNPEFTKQRSERINNMFHTFISWLTFKITTEHWSQQERFIAACRLIFFFQQWELGYTGVNFINIHSHN